MVSIARAADDALSYLTYATAWRHYRVRAGRATKPRPAAVPSLPQLGNAGLPAQSPPSLRQVAGRGHGSAAGPPGQLTAFVLDDLHALDGPELTEGLQQHVRL